LLILIVEFSPQQTTRIIRDAAQPLTTGGIVLHAFCIRCRRRRLLLITLFSSGLLPVSRRLCCLVRLSLLAISLLPGLSRRIIGLLLLWALL